MPIAAWLALAGLAFTVSTQGAVLAFFLGRLSQRVSTLEKDNAADAGLGEKIVRLEVQMEHVAEELKANNRHMAGVDRQLANLATKGGVAPFHVE